MRLTLDEYSKQFKMSKEMINSKLKAKKIDYVIEDGVTYITVANEETYIKPRVVSEKRVSRAVGVNQSEKKTTVATVLALYQRENKQLKDKILQLEEKIDRLIDDKEQMLRDERDRIEHVYTNKDEQLKNILELINTKLRLEQQPQTIHEIETSSSNDEIETKPQQSLVELRSYLKTLDLKSYQRKVIKRRFLSVYDEDIRIIQQNGNLYLDFSKYDYSDLLAY